MYRGNQAGLIRQAFIRTGVEAVLFSLLIEGKEIAGMHSGIRIHKDLRGSIHHPALILRGLAVLLRGGVSQAQIVIREEKQSLFTLQHALVVVEEVGMLQHLLPVFLIVVVKGHDAGILLLGSLAVGFFAGISIAGDVYNQLLRSLIVAFGVQIGRVYRSVGGF